MTKSIEDILLNGTIEQRKFLCSMDFESYLEYYFSDFIMYETPDFHFDMYDDLSDMEKGVITALIWIMFRESAKTTIAKIFVCWCICFNKRRFINWDSQDKDNAESALFDITISLQTNPRIIRDFGHLYQAPEVKTKHKKQKEMNRLNEFITVNGIKVKAYSTQKSTRGRVFGKYRPDFYIIDDFENEITVDSWPATRKVIKHIDSLKAGAGTEAWIMYLCNLISESGSVAHVLENAKGDPKARVRRVDVIDKAGELAWPGKYVLTDEEADKINANIMDTKKRKVSIESKRKSLTEKVFQQEMMNNPSATSDIVFDRIKIDALIKNAREPIETVAGFKMWAEFNPKCRYGGGADTAEGVGRDSNASAWIEFTSIPRVIVGTYENNKMPPDIFGFELKRQGDYFALPLLAIERNNTGHATIAGAKSANYPVKRLYKRVQEDKENEDITADLGWRTDGSTKTQVIYEFKSAIETGELVSYDIDLLRECRAYTLRDLEVIEYKEGMTRHFDKLMAAAIAWQMHKYALMPEADRLSYKQPVHTPTSRYGG